jgi:phenylpyruvate tautomerase PptA (4-oxalocrotonate tautomerase family)
MPLVRISLAARPPDVRERVGDAVHDALVRVAGVPKDDLFQVLEDAPQRVTRSYLGIEHAPVVAIVQVFLNAGRSVAVKQALYAAIADGVAAAGGLRREDVIISLVEVARENWSFGGGVMSYPPAP